MNMWWLQHRAGQIADRRSKMTPCKRCGLLYDKHLEACPKCTNIKEAELKLLLNKRAHSRISIGKGMFYGAIIIFVLMVIFTWR